MSEEHIEGQSPEEVTVEAVLKIFEEIKNVLNNHAESIKEIDRRCQALERMVNEPNNNIPENGASE